jgi:hypothetical protein
VASQAPTTLASASASARATTRGSGVLPTTGLGLIALAIAGVATMSWGAAARLIAARRAPRSTVR